MLCDRCKINPASLHFTTTQNGEKVELHLCERCAKETESVVFENVSFQDFFKGLLNMTMDHPVKVDSQKSSQQLRCPNCNMTYKEFNKTGKFGCAECYGTFEPYLENIMKRVHGSTQHNGKVPNRTQGALKIKRELLRMKEQLKNAVEKEEYETAAKLRDQIRDLEKEENAE